MVSITGGTYTQADTSGNSFSHTISSFSMGKYEVTYELWYTVRTYGETNGYVFANKGIEGHDGIAVAAPITKTEPVTMINWRDAIVWCNAYSEYDGRTPVYSYSGSIIKSSSNTTACDGAVVNWTANGYRLPTEGEWQYAASNKGLTPANYASGATADYTNATATGEVAWYSANSEGSTQVVGTKRANVLGLYDMSGNVSELGWDWYAIYPSGTQFDYKNESPGSSSRVIMGWHFDGDAGLMQLGYRYDPGPFAWMNGLIGFRVARSAL